MFLLNAKMLLIYSLLYHSFCLDCWGRHMYIFSMDYRFHYYLWWLMCKWWTEDNLKNVGYQVSTDFQILWKAMATSNCLVTQIIQNIFFCVEQKKLLQMWKCRVNKWWKKLHFCLTVPLKSLSNPKNFILNKDKHFW